MRSIFLVLFFFMAGCTLPPPPMPVQPDQPWTAFTARMAAVPDVPGFSARMSVTTISGKSGHRLTGDFWGSPASALRLDLQAGIGKTVSMLREDAANLQAFLPDSNRVYHHPDPSTGIRLLGLSTPFSLTELARILTGDWSPVIPRKFARTSSHTDTTRQYEFENDPRITSVVLDTSGRVLQVNGTQGWTLTLDRFPDPPALLPVARKLTVTSPNNDKLVIRIKSFTQRTTPWPPHALTLEVPEDAMYMLLLEE